MNVSKNPKPATLRRRERMAQLAAGKVPADQQDHGNPYWAKNWGCGCLTCKVSVSKLNSAQYQARKNKTTEGSK